MIFLPVVPPAKLVVVSVLVDEEFSLYSRRRLRCCKSATESGRASTRSQHPARAWRLKHHAQGLAHTIEGMEGLAAQAMDDLLNDSEDKLSRVLGICSSLGGC
jgi:hypothetical protein